MAVGSLGRWAIRQSARTGPRGPPRRPRHGSPPPLRAGRRRPRIQRRRSRTRRVRLRRPGRVACRRAADPACAGRRHRAAGPSRSTGYPGPRRPSRTTNPRVPRCPGRRRWGSSRTCRPRAAVRLRRRAPGSWRSTMASMAWSTPPTRARHGTRLCGLSPNCGHARKALSLADLELHASPAD